MLRKIPRRVTGRKSRRILMKGKMIVLVLDGFGMGQMPDADSKYYADTFGSLLKYQEDLVLPNLEALGLMNAYGKESLKMKFNPQANYGKMALMHQGADTFYGHQEMMGTFPKPTQKIPFSGSIHEIRQGLIDANYDVKYIGDQHKILLVNNCITVGDNLEADYGLAYNVTASFDYVSFEDVIKVGRVVRQHAKVPRVIAFGGQGVNLINIISSIHEKDNTMVGVSAPEVGVYDQGYEVIHMGYGIDPEVQAPTILGRQNIPVTLIGKVADIVQNDFGKSIPAVDTTLVMNELIQACQQMERGFICANVQETDLAGHDQNPGRYIQKLETVDAHLPKLKEVMAQDDVLCIVADHGNDPLIGHGKHTREYVPLLVYKKNLKNQRYGLRSTLSDIGATAVELFTSETATQNGKRIQFEEA